jgi:hypothetical protein
VRYGGIDQLAAHQHLKSGMNTKNHYRRVPCSSPAHMNFPFQCTNVMPQQSSAIEEPPPLQSTCTLSKASVCSQPCASSTPSTSRPPVSGMQYIAINHKEAKQILEPAVDMKEPGIPCPWSNAFHTTSMLDQ